MLICTVSAGGKAESFSESLPPVERDVQRNVQPYRYRLLEGEPERAMYRRMEQALLKSDAVLTVDPVDPEEAFTVFKALLADHPELFWVAPRLDFVTRLRNDQPYALDISFSYTATGEEKTAMKDEIDRETRKILKSVEHFSHPYEKVKGVYEYLITHTKYRSRITDQSLYSVLTKGKGVCAGYAKAFQYLMEQLGIESILVQGDLRQSESPSGILSLFTPFISEELNGHAWNLVRLGDRWYHVDVTSGEALTPTNRDISYSYLCLTSEQILKTHTIEEGMRIPNADSELFDYHRLNGWYFEDFSLKSYAKEFAEAHRDKARRFEVRFSSLSAYQAALRALFCQQEIFRVFKDAGIREERVNYLADEINYILSVEIP